MAITHLIDLEVRDAAPSQAARLRLAHQAFPATEEILLQTIADRVCFHRPLLVAKHIIADLRMVHGAIVRLDLRALCVATADDLLADVEGIRQHLDRHHVAFTHGFVPRSAVRELMESFA